MIKALKRRLSLEVMVFGLCPLLAIPSLANALENGGFEAELASGWQVAGVAEIETAAFGISPVAGERHVLISTYSIIGVGTPIGSVEHELRLPTGAIGSLYSEPITQGSAIAQIVDVAAGDRLLFSYNFLTNNDETSDALFNDFAFLSLVRETGGHDLQILADTYSGFIDSTSPFFRLQTGYQSGIVTFEEASTYVIGFGVVDVGDESFVSALLVDEIVISRRKDVSIPGDYNGNGTVEQGDLDLVLLNWGAEGTPPPAGWISELPQGFIDQAELDGVLLNWGSTAIPGSVGVPEPSGLGFATLLTGIAVLMWLRSGGAPPSIGA